jgi:hypothetical protein
VVHGVPGNPFLPFLPAPGEDRSPWVQTDARVQALLRGAGAAELIVCGHTHTALHRHIATPHGETTIVNPGPLSYRRGRAHDPGWAGYALLDWSASGGWQAGFYVVHYDPTPLYQALLAMVREATHRIQEPDRCTGKTMSPDGIAEEIDLSTYPIAAFIANRVRPEGAEKIPEERLDHVRYRWGDAPDWWDERDSLPAWRLLRGEAALP